VEGIPRLCIPGFGFFSRHREAVDLEKCVSPVIMSEQASSGPAEKVIGDEQRFDGGKSVVWIGAEFGHTRISGSPAMQRTRRHIDKVACHRAGPAPAAIKEQNAVG